jgi:hypothetical protein
VSTLHITNGDCVARPLRSVVTGRVILACDVLHEGPAPAGVEGAAWRELRARFLARDDAEGYREILHDMTAADEAVAEAVEHEEEVVLWFEHDLFDQLNLIRTLAVIHESSRTAVTLIGHHTFLGPLNRDELGALYPTRRRVTAGDYETARHAWSAFRSADPMNLVRCIGELRGNGRVWTGALKPQTLADALDRFLAEYPSTLNGLPRSEDAALRALMHGPLTGRELFPRSQAAEASAFLGDLPLFDMLLDLSRASVPLVALDGASTTESVLNVPVALTDAGHAVLAGDADAVHLNGIDRWRGGVHLAGHEVPWRWDPSLKTLVSWT